MVADAVAPDLRRAAAVLPRRRAALDHGFQRVGDSRGRVLGDARVDALLDLAAVVKRPLACGGQSHHRERSQTEVGGATVDAQPLNPDLRQPPVGHSPDPQGEPVAAAAVAVDAGAVDLLDEGRGQWQTGPRVRFSHSLVSLSLSRMSLDGKIRHATG